MNTLAESDSFHSALREMVRGVAHEVYAPVAASWDAERTTLPDSERKRLASLDLLGITIAEEYGGSGRPLIEALVAIEELAKVNQTVAFAVFEATTGPSRVIELFGSEAQRQRLLPPVVRGEKTIALAISEPDVGSAATDLGTRARIEGDDVIVSGVKRWSSGAGHAEQTVVYVRFDDEPGARGIGAVLIERDAPGVSFGPPDVKMGFHGIESADIFLDDVRVSVDNIIVPKGGFKNLFRAFSIERLGNATMSLAIGQRCLDLCSAYVVEREQFGRPIIDFQLVQSTIADMVMQVEAARLLIYRAASTAGRGTPVPLEASTAKCFANEMAKRVSDAAIQLHGGYGYTAEFEVERLHRNAHGWALAGGTPNIQRIRIASEFLGRRFDQRRG